MAENYREMYLKLFNAVSDAIETLKEAQDQAEEMYVNAEGDEN